jgi:hypothetical protein
MQVKRHKIKYHGIKDNQAIVSIRLSNGLPVYHKQHQSLEWDGDGYELLNELKAAIRVLEIKLKNKQNFR